MPKTSNLVFLATINLESVSTETREVVENIKLNGEECEIVRTEKVPVVVEGFFEWNGAQILTNKPTETYSEDGKHLMNIMFFSIGGRHAGDISTFKVFLTARHGRVFIGENQVNATIISKGSSAGNLPWDGTITIEEAFKPIVVGEFIPAFGSIVDTVNDTTETPTEPPTATETVGPITPDFNNIQIVGIADTVEPTTT